MATEDKSKASMTGLFDQAVKSYEQVVKTGQRLQEEWSRMWTGLATQSAGSAGAQDWQKKSKVLADDVVMQTQKNLEECLKLIDVNGRTSLELLKQAVAAGQAASVPEGQKKLVSLWENSLNAMRETAVAASQAQARAVEAWLGSVRKGWDTLAAKA